LIQALSRFFNIQAGETFRVTVMASLLFLLLAANNLIKILRDSIFLGRHSVSELPYLYILVAIVAGAIIATYTKFTVSLLLTRLILVTNAIIFSNVVFFWFLLTYFDSDWSHYAFYIWSAVASVIAVAQLWTLANQIFTAEEGKRTFGFLAAGGTAGGVAAALAVKWSLHLTVESNHLLWCVGGLYLAASAVVLWAERRLRGKIPERRLGVPEQPDETRVSGLGELLASSTYLKTIAVLILVSVIVSTLIDFQLKASAKEIYPSREALAGFFSSYYGWLSVATLFAQVLLTGRTLNKFGLNSSLYLTPTALLTGSLALLIQPTLVVAALTRMADATLRNSIHRSGMEIVYMALPASVIRAVKGFLDVVLERVGDASAGFIILLFSFTSMERYITYVHFVCVALIFVWFGLIKSLKVSFSAPTGQALVSQDLFVRDE
jgi:ATP:ADP antiporter, AAA family